MEELLFFVKAKVDVTEKWMGGQKSERFIVSEMITVNPMHALEDGIDSAVHAVAVKMYSKERYDPVENTLVRPNCRSISDQGSAKPEGLKSEFEYDVAFELINRLN